MTLSIFNETVSIFLEEVNLNSFHTENSRKAPLTGFLYSKHKDCFLQFYRKKMIMLEVVS